MLNADLLDQGFVETLKKSWDEAAVWPGCVEGYENGISHAAYGQCLVGTLAAWAKHPDLSIVPGIAIDENNPEGVWHFMLGKKDKLIDVTYDQFVNFTSFEKAQNNVIARESLLNDNSLESRLSVIFSNLEKQGIDMPEPSQVVAKAVAHLKL